MAVTLNEMLALVGRLDDAEGFDTPRERFRRFLVEYVTDAGVARSLVDQSQHSLGDQHHRALQDTIVVLGRFLGFETVFGTSQRAHGSPTFDGQWRSRRRLEIVLDVRTDHTPRSDIVELSRSLSALATPASDVRHLALCIVTPLYGGRARLEEALVAEKSRADLRIVSIRSLLWLADMVGAGRLQHHEIVRLLTSGASVDFVVDLMERFETGNRDGSRSRAPVEALPPPSHGEPAHWAATTGRDETTIPDQKVESITRAKAGR
jgi:hypothetical protein